MKTDNASKISLHCFETAGLGKAPFRCIGVRENLIVHPDGTRQPGGTCKYCFTGILNECIVQSADGKVFAVGCDCIRRVDDSGLWKSYKTHPQVRAMARAKRQQKDASVTEQLQSMLSKKAQKLAALPHPRGFLDRLSGQPLTAYDWAAWMMDNCGAAGRSRFLKELSAI